METKEIINKISDQKNVAEMRTELNELKVLLNSIESTINSYSSAQDAARNKATELSAKAAELYSNSLAVAQEKFKAEEAELVKGRETALEELNTAINRLGSIKTEISDNEKKLQEVENNIEVYNNQDEEYNAQISELTDFYNKESKEFNIGLQVGQITTLKDARFFSMDDISSINRLFRNIFSSAKKIDKFIDKAFATAAENYENAKSVIMEDLSCLVEKKNKSNEEIENIKMELSSFNDMIAPLTAEIDAYKETYDAIVVKLDALRKDYTDEVNTLVSQYDKGSISLEKTYFMPMEKVTELGETLEAKAKEEFAVTEYQEKIDSKLNEGDMVAKKISDLEPKVNELLIQREVCRQAVGNVADKAVKTTTEVAGSVVKGIGKSAKVASNLAKVGLNRAKKEVDSFMKDLSSTINEATSEENYETTVETDNQTQNSEKTIFGESVEDIKKFLNGINFEDSLNEFAEETKMLAKEFDVDKTIEQGKTYVKSLFNKYNNQNNNDKSDDEE